MKKFNLKVALQGSIRKTPIIILGLFGGVALMWGTQHFAKPTEQLQANVSQTNIVISQVSGGGGTSGATYKNDFIELYNPSTSSISVAGWTVQYASSTGKAWKTTALSGTIAPGQYYLIQEAAGTGGTLNLPTPNATGTIAMSATAGKVALVSNSTKLTVTCPTGLVDFVGYGSGTNCYEGTGPTTSPSNTTAALRNANGATDTDNNANDFSIGAPNPRNIPPADIAPTVSSTTPVNGATDVTVDANITVNFSEAVTVTGAWYTLSCSLSGAHTATVTGGPTTFTVNPDVNFTAGDNCTFTVVAGQVADQDGTPNNMTSNYILTFTSPSSDPCTQSTTPIYQIQGSGTSAALTGSRTTCGVVVGDYEGSTGTLGGFYIQDPTGDANLATSDGIFVSNGTANTVSLGDRVRVAGTVSEVSSQTKITGTTITKYGTGTVSPAMVSMPFASATDAEKYEGMLVQLPTMYVTEHYLLGRFGQVSLSSGSRLKQPTNVTTPGSAALALQASNNLNMIIMDDASQVQNPDPILFGRGGAQLTASNTLRGGDTSSTLVGVMTQTTDGYNATISYRFRPVNALNGNYNFSATNPRPTAPQISGTPNVKVAGMNLLNLFNTFKDSGTGCWLDGGVDPLNCRGADNQTEFDRQWPKTVQAIIKTGADVIGVNEIENDGYGSTSTIKFLVDKLNLSAGAGTYAFINVGNRANLGTDAIAVGMLYKPSKVTPIGTTAVLESTAFVNGGDSFPRNRVTFAQAFQITGGGKFIMNVNHLKSKGSACDNPDAGDGQGNCNIVRTNAANTLMTWLATNPTATGVTDIILLGDLNSYAKEDPITAIKNAGYTNLIESLLGADAYSYVFDGQWGYLDHALASASLAAKVTGIGDYHINADEPGVLDYNTNFKSTGQITSLYAADEFRMSDHDTVVVGLNIP